MSILENTHKENYATVTGNPAFPEMTAETLAQLQAGEEDARLACLASHEGALWHLASSLQPLVGCEMAELMAAGKAAIAQLLLPETANPETGASSKPAQPNEWQARQAMVALANRKKKTVLDYLARKVKDSVAEAQILAHIQNQKTVLVAHGNFEEVAAWRQLEKAVQEKAEG